MSENETPIIRIEDHEAIAKRGLGHDLLVAGTQGTAAGLSGAGLKVIADKVLNRPPKEEPTPSEAKPPDKDDWFAPSA